jgi:hypothetical protein
MSPSSRPRKLALVLATTALVAAPAPAIAMPAGPDAPASAIGQPLGRDALVSDVPSLAGLPALEAARDLAASARGGDAGGVPEVVAVWGALIAVAAAGGAALGRHRAHPLARG